jgi:hemerythrin-like domain-containing protein
VRRGLLPRVSNGPMRRDPALVSLSHDHHQALFVAQALRRANASTAADARAAFLAYWNQHGRIHFRLEEEILLPAYAGYGDCRHALVARVLCDHIAIRQLANELTACRSPSPSTLWSLGTQVSDHVRLEERELFPLIERTLPAPALSDVADALNEAERLLSNG